MEEALSKSNLHNVKFKDEQAYKEKKQLQEIKQIKET